MKVKITKGDMVEIIAGNEKGSRGACAAGDSQKAQGR